MRISLFLGQECLTDNRSISNATQELHEMKKVQLPEHFTLVTQDSIGHLKTLCMSILSPAVAFESEWKRYSSLQSDKKKQNKTKKQTLAFNYEFSFRIKLHSPFFADKSHHFHTEKR